MNLINADKLIESFEPEHNCDWYTPWIIDKINQQPKIEAVPVAHGEWIYENYTWHCGKCGFHPFKGYIPATPGFNFCPNCGAKMDGKKTSHLVEIVRMIKDSGMSKEELERLFFREESVKNE